MKQPKAYRVNANGEMLIRPVLEMQFSTDGSANFHIGDVGWFKQVESVSTPLGHISDSATYRDPPFRIFGSEIEAWAFEIENLYAKKKGRLHKEIDAIVYLIDRADINLAKAKASQNETIPPK